MVGLRLGSARLQLKPRLGSGRLDLIPAVRSRSYGLGSRVFITDGVVVAGERGVAAEARVEEVASRRELGRGRGGTKAVRLDAEKRMAMSACSISSRRRVQVQPKHVARRTASLRPGCSRR